MLAQKNRLPARAFREIKRDAKTTHTRFFVMRYRRTGDGEPPRFGFVISSKVCKRAVDRHRIKRRLAAIIEGRLADIERGTEVVLYLKPAASEASHAELVESVAYALRKSGLERV